ncbi:MAG: hypothetical protein AB1646_22725 [Thermodesulfobacteriota bacterium]
MSASRDQQAGGGFTDVALKSQTVKRRGVRPMEQPLRNLAADLKQRRPGMAPIYWVIFLLTLSGCATILEGIIEGQELKRDEEYCTGRCRGLRGDYFFLCRSRCMNDQASMRREAKENRRKEEKERERQKETEREQLHHDQRLMERLEKNTRYQ